MIHGIIYDDILQKAVPTYFLCKSCGKHTWDTIFFLNNHRIGCFIVKKFFELSFSCLSFFLKITIQYGIPFLLKKLRKWLEHLLECHASHCSRRAARILQGPCFLEVPYIFLFLKCGIETNIPRLFFK